MFYSVLPLWSEHLVNVAMHACAGFYRVSAALSWPMIGWSVVWCSSLCL